MGGSQNPAPLAVPSPLRPGQLIAPLAKLTCLVLRGAGLLGALLLAWHSWATSGSRGGSRSSGRRVGNPS